MSGATVRYRTNPRFVPDGASIRFGGGGDASLGSDGTDLELLLSATADLVLGRTGVPSPDSLLHLWSATAGTVAAPADSLAVLENDGAASFGVLVPAASYGGLRVGFPSPGTNADAYLLHYGPSATPADAWLLGIDGSTRLQYSAGAFAFQEATAISTVAGDLTLNPDGDVVIPAGDVLSVDDTTDSTGGTTGSIHTDGGLGVAKAIYGQSVNTVSGGTATPNMTHKGGGGNFLEAVWSGMATVPDDGTGTILTDAIETGLLILTINQGSNSGIALIQLRANTTPKVAIVSQSGDFTVAVTTADVTGTTGVDTQVTVSVRASVVEIENRFGANTAFGWYLIGHPG